MTDNRVPVCCYCDTALSCASCGMEQPYSGTITDGLKQAANWLRRQANAEKEPKAKAAFIEAHNAILALALAPPTEAV